MRAEKKVTTRRKLVAIARAAFQHQGFEEVTMRGLAKSAGVSTGSYFANWKSKAALYADVMGRPAPDIAHFLAKVAIDLAGTDHAALGAEAEDLRRSLLGGHG